MSRIAKGPLSDPLFKKQALAQDSQRRRSRPPFWIASRALKSRLSAAARVPGAPAHLSVQSAFPSLADRPYSLLSCPHCIPSLGDRGKAQNVAESRPSGG